MQGLQSFVFSRRASGFNTEYSDIYSASWVSIISVSTCHASTLFAQRKSALARVQFVCECSDMSGTGCRFSVNYPLVAIPVTLQRIDSLGAIQLQPPHRVSQGRLVGLGYRPQSCNKSNITLARDVSRYLAIDRSPATTTSC